MRDYEVKEGVGDTIVFTEVTEREKPTICTIDQTADGMYFCVVPKHRRMRIGLFHSSFDGCLSYVVGHLCGREGDGRATFNGKTAEEFMEYAREIERRDNNTGGMK